MLSSVNLSNQTKFKGLFRETYKAEYEDRDMMRMDEEVHAVYHPYKNESEREIATAIANYNKKYEIWNGGKLPETVDKTNPDELRLATRAYVCNQIGERLPYNGKGIEVKTEYDV